MPPAEQAKLRSLLSHNPSTAGGLMNADFISVPSDATAADALEQLRSAEGLNDQHLAIVCVVEAAGKLLGTVSLPELVRASDAAHVSELADASTPSVAPETEVPEVARLMSDFNLIAMPVLDGQDRPIGIIAVDDVLELLVPEEWRRRAGVARD
jgi:Mg/Co/Ni transporter MgtE